MSPIFRILLAWLTAALLLVAPSCGSRQGAPSGARGTAPDVPASPVVVSEEGMRLVTSMPPLAGLATGAEFDFTLSAEFSAQVYQGSARILYDSSVLLPLESKLGELLPADFVVLLRHDSAPGTLALSRVDRPAALNGCIPFAFTGRPGTDTSLSGTGELARVRFRLIGVPQDDTPVRLQNDPAFLQLRDARGVRIGFDLDREVLAR